MARTMLDEMVEVLKAGGVRADKIGRYKTMWNAADKDRGPWPCPMCFYITPHKHPGNLKIIDVDGGVGNAWCNTCGPLTCNDFEVPKGEAEALTTEYKNALSGLLDECKKDDTKP
ncbi:MAG: hypothetical protein OHM77_04685 [Candidatus Nitricoxidivorans perseverans]|uniref:Uncharacterized protein n=1 Tax=Candidatus Nitricoxidivorans perseverans TaxID=2975601 RepID=A0AA49FNE4_9PROT|nr:MAG: hypothetical protein OHM77_04685 [Candidatus Nitricoxidivorans perseverans]